MSEWWDSDEPSPDLSDWSDDDPPPELSKEVIDYIVQSYFDSFQSTPIASSRRAPSQIQGLNEEHRGNCFATDVEERGTPPGEDGRKTMQGEESESGPKNPQALEENLQLKGLRQEELTDPAEEDGDNREMAVETGGSLAVGNALLGTADDGRMSKTADDGQMSKKVKGPKCMDPKTRNKKQRAQEKRVQMEKRMQTEQKENEKVDVPEERDIHSFCFLWWLEGYVKPSPVGQVKRRPVKCWWQMEATD